MKNKSNQIILINIISTFVLQGIAFITTPIFTRILGTSQYGIYSLFNSWVLILTCVMGLSLSSSLGTGMYTYKDKYIEFRNSLLLTSLFICILQLVILSIFRKSISNFLGFSDNLIILIGICSIGHYMVNYAQLCFIYEKKALNNLILSVTVALFSVLLSIILILKFNSDDKYLGRVYGTTVIYSIVSIILFFALFLKKPVGLHSNYFKYGFVVGFPIVFHSLSQQILGQSDRVMMQMYNMSTAEIGIYSLFYTLSSVLTTVLGALNNSWCPFYYDDVNEERWEVLDRKCKNYIELFTVIAVGFLFLSREVFYLMADKSYKIGINILPILTLAVYFTFMYQFPVNFEFFHKKTKIIAMGTVGAGIMNIFLNAIMIPQLGMYGAATATALSYLALFLAHYCIVINMKEHRYHLKITVFIPGIISMFMAVIMFYMFSDLWYVRWALGVAIGCFELWHIYKRKSIF